MSDSDNKDTSKTNQPPDSPGFEVVNRYMLEVKKNYVKNLVATSDLDLSNIRQVMESASIGVEQRHLINQADVAYKTLSLKLMGSIKIHLNHQDYRYIEKWQTDVGHLKFNVPSLYLKGTDIEGDRMITPSDRALAYEFLMFRSIAGTKAVQTLPKFVLSFQKNSDKQYTEHEVIDSFSYHNKNHAEILGHKSAEDGSGGKVLNEDAFNIFKKDRIEVEKIIKNVFKEYANECNVLKNTDPFHQIIVCNSFNDYTDPDYFIGYATCLEEFNLAGLSGFCNDVTYQGSITFD